MKIVVDTSALIAIVGKEPAAEACIASLERASAILISAATLTEALIVAARRNVETEIAKLIVETYPTIIELTEKEARQAGEAYRRWGKGFHPARLNYGDCFAYATAKEFNCPLLYIGNDFSQTDIVSALAGI